ncbi:MAG: TVP38/TMEM64 family protein, partial [Caulobacteraceae bacterium]|nr:TVP38/TMEM64 family protein [Caulobacter sp.]
MLLVALVAAFAFSGAWRWLSLDALRDRRAALTAFVQAHPVLSLELYAAAYMAVVALSLPGALIMSLGGGYLFGAWMGAGAALVGE